MQFALPEERRGMKVPLSIFSTFVAASPSAKLACIEQFKAGYDVRSDWYKQLREAITSNHRDGGSQADLAEFAERTTGKKAGSFHSRVSSYCRWWGARNIKWIGGRAFIWQAGETEVAVNPELVVSIDGVRHVIKLYFSAERLSADRGNAMLRLMEIGYREGATPEGRPVVGVLDIARENLIVPTRPLGYLDPLLVGEAASFAAITRA